MTAKTVFPGANGWSTQSQRTAFAQALWVAMKSMKPKLARFRIRFCDGREAFADDLSSLAGAAREVIEVANRAEGGATVIWTRSDNTDAELAGLILRYS